MPRSSMPATWLRMRCKLLEGGKGAAVYAVQARKREDGLTEADIVVNGAL